MPLIDDVNDYLDQGLNGFKRILDTRDAAADAIYRSDQRAEVLASDRARLQANTAIATIEAQASVDRANAAATAEKFSFTNLRGQLASGFGSLQDSPYTVPVAVAVAFFAGLYLVRAQ